MKANFVSTMRATLKVEKNIWNLGRRTVWNDKQRQNIQKSLKVKKQPPRSVLRKRWSENKQQIYRRKPMPKCVLLGEFMGVLL